MLSILATHDIDGYVPGINNLLEGGYQMPDGTTALSAEEKLNADRLPSPPWMHSAKRIRQVTKQVPQQLARHWTKRKYFGYGYIKDPAHLVPNVGLTFWSFRIMVGLGGYFILFFIIVLIVSKKRNWLICDGCNGWLCGLFH